MSSTPSAETTGAEAVQWDLSHLFESPEQLTTWLDETDESIIVEITSVTNGSESGTQQVTAIITDDDGVAPDLLQVSLDVSGTVNAGRCTCCS